MQNTAFQQVRADAHAIYQAAVRAVQPDRLLAGFDLAAQLGRRLEQYRRVIVVGAGRASMAMAGALEQHLGGGEVGLVGVPEGYRAAWPAAQAAPKLIQVVEAGHPVPTAAGVQAAQQVLHLAETATEDELLLVLISGGGSALWPLFAEGIALEA